MAASIPEFRATHTQTEHTSIRPWVVREVVLGILALGAMAVPALVLRHPKLFEKIDVLPDPAWKAILSVGALLGFRTFIWRPGLAEVGRRVMFRVHGYEGIRDRQYFDAWGQRGEDRTIVSVDGARLHAKLIRGEAGKVHTGECVIFCFGNGTVYEEYDPREFEDLTAAGYDVLLYHPPGYGKSTGSHTVRSHLLAGEAVLQSLNPTFRRGHQIHSDYYRRGSPRISDFGMASGSS